MTDDEAGERVRGRGERERGVGGSEGGEERKKREGDKALGEEETSDVEGLRKSQEGRRRGDGERETEGVRGRRGGRESASHMT